MCRFRQNDYYGADMVPEGGATYIVLNPRNLNGHATIPAPPITGDQDHFDHPDLDQKSKSKWSINSTNSVEEGEERVQRGSIDLEWENDGMYVH